MNQIIDILQRRDTDSYYTDCAKGVKLNKIYQSTYELAYFDLQELPDIAVVDRARRMFPAAKFRRLTRSGMDREKMITDIADLEADRRVRSMARKLGCLNYEQCRYCPDGRWLTAKEIYEYAMGG